MAGCISKDLARFLKCILSLQTVFIFGLCGALRCDEFTKITTDDVDDHGRLYLVHFKDTKTKKDRAFTITGAFYDIAKKYLALRPTGALTNLNYQRGKCTPQVIGKQKIAKMPARIAEFLNLKNPEEYTGKFITSA